MKASCAIIVRNYKIVSIDWSRTSRAYMQSLFAALSRLAQLQHERITQAALHDAVSQAFVVSTKALDVLDHVASSLGAPEPYIIEQLDATHLPVLAWAIDSQRWGVLVGLNARQQWVLEWFEADGNKVAEESRPSVDGLVTFNMRLSLPADTDNSPSLKVIRAEFFAARSLLWEAALGGVIINLVALGISMYTMQVYDRVVPTGALSTLQVLTLGVFIAIIFELLTKLVRSQLHDRLIERVDRRLARSIYLKFLNTRLDQMPASVGGLSAQMRGYETVRSFLSSAATHMLVDMPFVVIYVAVIYALAGQLVAIPVGFLLVVITVGLIHKRKIEAHAEQATQASNRKTGLLVEAIEGAETIKSGQAGWRMLGNWIKTTDEAREHDLRIRSLTERTSYLTAALQQASYVLLVASGALLIGRESISMGGLIACSILSGRILAPLAALPGLLLQWAHSKAALKGLDRLWKLEDDHAGAQVPVVPSTIAGRYQFNRVKVSYNGRPALSVPELLIRPGEKIGVLGPIGAGKTTLLRLFSGMYKPEKGQVLLDGVNLAHISKPVLADHIGYLQQEGRLFAGTLRENLILGMIDPGDSSILDAAQRTGLLQIVIQSNPLGLQQPIFEGGQGLSSGQRQLVNFTRVLLRSPRVWLLDEPTASMDQQCERRIINLLREELKPGDTFVLITHKPGLLALVDRLLVVVDHRVVMDGPKNAVLDQLSRHGASQARPPAESIANTAGSAV